ncbi:hypothetical protein FBUS_07462 [Fasciolopsis buskii]|uniref:Uncharacterized protein n=1 Tax=Fasciolopsis buskii TaxID=27845 RepID=A0A8E0VJS3_9TREM|nr:hypothetical protein FBUS_07462 [Fasciolopsis buski]
MLNVALVILLTVGLAAVIFVFIAVLLIAWFRARNKRAKMIEQSELAETKKPNSSLDELDEGVYYEVS